MIVIGVDVHKQSVTAVAVDEAGRMLDEKSVVVGSEELLGWAAGLGKERLWALEDCRRLTRWLERQLLAGHERLVRVPPKLMAPERRAGRGRGKSDAIHAVSITRLPDRPDRTSTEGGTPLSVPSGAIPARWPIRRSTPGARRESVLRRYVHMTDTAMAPDVTIVAANQASWEDLQTVLGSRGYHSGCWCQRHKLRGREGDSDPVPVAERANRLRKQTRCGQPESDTTSGLVAYLDGEPAGWCAVEPRTAYVRLGRGPWTGRAEDRTDDSVWAVTCFVTRTGFRHRGISRALTRATVDFARQGGARALEAYR